MNNVIQLRPEVQRVSVSQMAELLKVNPETIRRYIRHEIVPSDCWVQNLKKEYSIDPRKFVAALDWVSFEEAK